MSDFQLALQAFADRRIPLALELLERSERTGHDPDECSAYRWLCRMLQGRFEDAWRESDRIAARGHTDPGRLWDGCPFDGCSVMIRCLHGYGDAIQFIRYAREVRKRAARVIVQTHPQLVSLMRAVPFVDDAITWSGRSPEWDRHIEVMELPRAFRTTLDTIPNDVPYLYVNPQAAPNCPVAATSNGKLRIGLQWGSGEWDPARSLSLSQLLPVLEIPGVEFYSFQRGAPRAELRTLPSGLAIRDVSGESPEIIHAAADLMNIDLLISVDTMLAHLAGALGRPVWLLLPFAADWRWMLDREDSPWYPTMRLFRQPSAGDWPGAVRRMASELPEFVVRTVTLAPSLHLA